MLGARIAAIALGFSCYIDGSVGLASEPDRSTEYEVKAAFLYNIAKFVTWPDAAFANGEAPMILGLLGEDPIGPALNAIDGQLVHGRLVSVRRYTEMSSITACHILFISRSEASRFEEALRAVRGPVLTVSDIEDFSERGGCFTLSLAGGKVRIQSNPDALARAGLSASAKLLQLSTIVKESQR